MTKQVLFKNLNAKLTALAPELGSDIVCPLCLRRFGPDSIRTELTIEHVPPQAAGRLIAERRMRTLTCKRCNNTFGSKYQADLKLFLRCQLHSYGKYTGPIPGYIDMPGVTNRLHANIVLTPGSLIVTGVPEANNPATTDAHTAEWDNIAAQHITDYRFSTTLNFGYRLPVAWAAYIQVAYLAAYILRDDAYIFSKAGREIRRLMTAGRLDQVGPCLIENRAVDAGGKPWMAAILEPSELKCFWVKVAGNIVILPLPTDSNLSCYQAWQKVSDQTIFGLKPGKINFRITFWSEQDVSEALKIPGMLLQKPLGGISDAVTEERKQKS